MRKIEKISDNIKTPKEFSSVLSELNSYKIEKINWSEFPYAPPTIFKFAYNKYAIFVAFEVSREKLKCVETEINGEVFLDSCVEVFFSFNDDENYFNFEINSDGVAHLAHGKDRNKRVFVDKNLIKKHLEIYIVKSDIVGSDEKKWSLAAVIPGELLGFDFNNLRSIRINGYKIGGNTDIEHYVSLFPIETDKPDFHQPQFFEKFIV